jgi:hypothetical protein
VLRHGFAGAILVALVVLLWRERADVGRSLEAVSGWRIAASLALVSFGAWLPGLVWRNLLTVQGYPTRRAAGLRAFFIAQLGKYLPGGVWAYVAQIAMARDLGIPARQAASATFLTLALSIISGLLLAGVTLPFALPHLVGEYWWAFLVVPVLIALLLPRSVAWWSATAFRLLRRPGERVELSGGVLVRASSLLLLSWVAFGLHFAVLIQGLDPAVASPWLLSMGAFSLAWVAGFMVVVAPAGAGVREGALVLGFAGLLPAGAVLTIALLSRLLFVVADVLLAAVTVVASRATDGRPAGEGP